MSNMLFVPIHLKKCLQLEMMSMYLCLNPKVYSQKLQLSLMVHTCSESSWMSRGEDSVGCWTGERERKRKRVGATKNHVESSMTMGMKESSGRKCCAGWLCIFEKSARLSFCRQLSTFFFQCAPTSNTLQFIRFVWVVESSIERAKGDGDKNSSYRLDYTWKLLIFIARKVKKKEKWIEENSPGWLVVMALAEIESSHWEGLMIFSNTNKFLACSNAMLESHR